MRRSCWGALLSVGLLCTLGSRHAEGGHDSDLQSSISHQVSSDRSGTGQASHRRLHQAGASDGSTQQVAAKAQNTIDGQLNFPDPEHGPKPQVLVQQFQQKVDQAVPVVGPKLVNATNALYQHMDLAPVMTRLMSLAQNNFVGLFPGSNPYGFQADPNTFCLFAVPKDGTPDPTSQLNSWLQKGQQSADGVVSGIASAANSLPSSLPEMPSQLPTLPTTSLYNAFAAKQAGTAPDLGVVSMEKNGKSYVCTPYQPFGAVLPTPNSAAGAPTAADTSPLRFPDGSPLGLPAPAPEAAPLEATALTSATRQYVTSFLAQQPASSPAAAQPAIGAAAAQAPALDPLFANLFDDDSGYGQAPSPGGGYGSSGVKRPPIAYYNNQTGGVVITPPKSLFVNFGKDMDRVLQGKTGNPFFDCVGMNSGAVPFKSFVQANGNNAQTLANHFVSYLKGDLSTPDGGLADKLTLENPFDPNSKPINLKFNAERPYFNLPQGGLPFLSNPATSTGVGPTTLQQGPPLLPPGAIQGPGANPAVANSAAFSAVDTGNMPTITSVVFDGFLSDCTVIIGSYPHGDGTFDKANDFQSVVVDGAWTMGLATAKLHAGQVAYIVPAAKGNSYPALDGSTNRPGFCYDTALLLPEFNPMAVPMPPSDAAGSSGLVASPLTTVLVFSQAAGLTSAQLHNAFGIDQGIDLTTFNALGDAMQNPNGIGMSILKVDVTIQNMVTLGATVLNNNSASYASYAILMDQAIGHQAASGGAAYSPSSGRHLLQGSGHSVDLTQGATVASLISFAQASAGSNPDPSVRGALASNFSSEFLPSAAAAIANLNGQTDAATNAADVEKTAYYAQAVLAGQLLALRSGAMTLADFASATSSDAMAAALAKTALPGRMVAPGTSGAAPLGSGASIRASSGAGGSGGLSRLTVILMATIIPCAVVVLAIVVAAIVARTQGEQEVDEADLSLAYSGGSGRYWWRSPLWGRGDSGSAPSGHTLPSSSMK